MVNNWTLEELNNFATKVLNDAIILNNRLKIIHKIHMDFYTAYMRRSFLIKLLNLLEKRRKHEDLLS